MSTTEPQAPRMASKGTLAWRRVRSRAAAIAVVVALLSGCVTVPPVPKTEYQAALGKVAVVAAAQEPKIEFKGFTRGKVEGAAKGAGMTFVQCFGGAAGCGGGTGCAVVAIAALGVCAVASPVGGVVGAIIAPSAGEVQAAEGALSAAVDVRTIQESLRDEVVAAALAYGTPQVAVSSASAQDAVPPRDDRPLAATGADTVLEVALTKVGTEGSGIDPPLELRMEAHVRLTRTRDNAELVSADYVYLGERLKLSEWSANQAERLLRALKAGYETLGSHIYDNVFLLYPLPDREAWWAPHLVAAPGLASIYPPTLRNPELPYRELWYRNPPTVDSLQPTLRWQSFPRVSDIRKAPEEMGRVENVRYDLVIAREHNRAPAEVVYRREGLPGNAHTIETPLNPATRYFWTVRARFDLDGRQRVTEWGSTAFMAREHFTAPSRWSYPFKTP